MSKRNNAQQSQRPFHRKQSYFCTQRLLFPTYVVCVSCRTQRAQQTLQHTIKMSESYDGLVCRFQSVVFKPFEKIRLICIFASHAKCLSSCRYASHMNREWGLLLFLRRTTYIYILIQLNTHMSQINKGNSMPNKPKKLKINPKKNKLTLIYC